MSTATTPPQARAGVTPAVATRNRGKGGWSTKQRPPEERFWEKVDASGDCWEWTGGKKPHGYGTFGIHHGRAVLPHRYAWEILLGPIPAGLTVDHQCRNRLCVNPAHLRLVTQRVNTLASHGPSALNARKTHCAQGHPYDTANTRYSANGWRTCRACSRAKHRTWQAKQRVARKAGEQ